MEMEKDNKTRKSIPYNLNRKISEEEINTLLELAATQVSGDSTQDKIKHQGGKEKKATEAKKREEEKKKEAEKKAAEAKKKEAEKKAAEAKKREAEKKAAEAKKREAEKKATEAKKKAEEKKAAEAKKREEEKKAAEAKKREAEKKAAEAKKKEEEKKAAEAKKREEEKKAAEAKKKEKEKRVAETAKKEDMDEVYVTNSQIKENPYKEKLTFGRMAETFFETVWMLFKIAVIVCVVTIISGFFLSRDLMIRGRSGGRQCLQGMTVASNVANNKSLEFSKVNVWLDKISNEKITLEADDEKILVAKKFVTDSGSNDWAVILHGYGEDMEDVYDIAMHYSEEGYNVLLPDLRAHGESEGSFYGMGWLDRLDVINWIDVILDEDPSAKVVIHGVDIGADTALMLSGEPLKDNIKVIVAEGAYTSAWDVVKKEYKVRHPKLPTFPFLHMINPVMKVWAGYSLKEADALKQVENADVPILLIYGNNDTYTDAGMVDELNEAVASKHEVFTVANGSHGDCRYSDMDTYYDKTFQFVDTYMK